MQLENICNILKATTNNNKFIYANLYTSRTVDTNFSGVATCPTHSTHNQHGFALRNTAVYKLSIIKYCKYIYAKFQRQGSYNLVSFMRVSTAVSVIITQPKTT